VGLSLLLLATVKMKSGDEHHLMKKRNGVEYDLHTNPGALVFGKPSPGSHDGSQRPPLASEVFRYMAELRKNGKTVRKKQIEPLPKSDGRLAAVSHEAKTSPTAR
jgi:hypothetical protein